MASETPYVRGALGDGASVQMSKGGAGPVTAQDPALGWTLVAHCLVPRGLGSSVSWGCLECVWSRSLLSVYLGCEPWTRSSVSLVPQGRGLGLAHSGRLLRAGCIGLARRAGRGLVGRRDGSTRHPCAFSPVLSFQPGQLLLPGSPWHHWAPFPTSWNPDSCLCPEHTQAQVRKSGPARWPGGHICPAASGDAVPTARFD